MTTARWASRQEDELNRISLEFERISQTNPFQAAVDQLLAPETLDTIVNYLVDGEFCANSGDDRCPDIVFTLINYGLPMIAEASDAVGFAQVVFNILKWVGFGMSGLTKGYPHSNRQKVRYLIFVLEISRYCLEL